MPKGTKAMSKQQLGVSNWLHIVSSAIANYVDEGGAIAIVENGGALAVTFLDVGAQDVRLHADFVALLQRAVTQ
jgi:hypothetical protein